MIISKKTGSLFFFVSILFSSASSKTTDIVDTKDGSIYKGSITEEDTASIAIELEGGSLIRIPHSNILKIRHNTSEKGKGFHQHDGFFLSMNMGGGLVSADWERANNTGSGTATLSGGAVIVDFKIGGTVGKNLILSFDIVETGGGMAGDFSGKGMDVNGLGAASSPDSASGAVLGGFGLGGTYYFMPYNGFLSGTLGLGTLQVRDKFGLKSNPSSLDDLFDRSSNAFGYFLQLKAGREWWVSNNWGLGITATYTFFSGDEEEGGEALTPYVLDPSYKGSFNVHQFGILFNTTFN